MKMISIVLAKLMLFCSCITDIYPLIMTLFTLLTKILLLPISVWAHYNSIKMVKMSADIYDYKINYYGDRDMINEKTAELYNKEKYHPFLSVIPLFVQFVLLLGVIEVVKTPENAGMSTSDLVFAGVDYNFVASQAGGWYIIFPIGAAVSSLLMCWTQNKSQVLQAEQGVLNKYGILVFSTALSLYLGFFVSCSVVLYWIASNMLSIIQMYILNAVINPKKYIDYSYLKDRSNEYQKMSASGGVMTREMKKRQKADYKKFFSIANKHIVFYSEKSGFYKYYERLINWLICHSNVVIHYVTSDPEDIIFDIGKTTDRIRPYYIGQNKLITLFMKMDAKIVVMTTPDLDNYYLKRSYVDKNVEYIYTDHGITGFNITARKGAFDHFDTIFCTTERDCQEIRAYEKLHKLPEKTLVKTGYGNLDKIAMQFEQYSQEHTAENCEYILIAPSYQSDNILENGLEQIVDAVVSLGLIVVIRPHPQFVRRKRWKWEEIERQYQNFENVILESDFSSNETIYKAAVLITDWSSIAYEYCFAALRPCLFIDTPIKAINPDYKEIDVVPLMIELRDKVGLIAAPCNKEETKDNLKTLLDHREEYREKIERIRSETVFNFMKSDEVGGKYILSQLKNRKEQN